MSRKPSVARGLGNRAGKRTKRLSVPKGELMDVCSALHERGLGGSAISQLLGYTPEMVNRYLRDSGCELMSSTLRVQKIIKHLPDDLKAWVLRIKTKSDIAHERSWARVRGEDVCRHLHEIDDGVDD